MSDTRSDENSEPLFWKVRLVHGTIDFSAYKELKLSPIEDVEFPEPDCNETSNFSNLVMYQRMTEDDWRMLEGSILYVLAEYGNFINCISHYNKHQRTCIKDDLFGGLKSSGYHKNIIPCMVGVKKLQLSSHLYSYRCTTVFWPKGWMS